jgi:predicted Zn-dependent protease with MMP-like domain
VTKTETEMCVDQVMDAIDEEIAEALADVQVFVVEGRTDPELKTAIRYAEMPRALVRRDFRGLYLGTTARALSHGVGDDAGAAVPQLPYGAIVLNCEAVTGLDDVRDTLAHEMGHALGMSEEEVENLGLG